MPFPKAVEQEVAAQEIMSTEVMATAEPNPSLGKFFQFHIYFEQVTSAAVSLDVKFSSGIDNLVEKMPALKQATPALYDSTR